MEQYEENSEYKRKGSASIKGGGFRRGSRFFVKKAVYGGKRIKRGEVSICIQIW